MLKILQQLLEAGKISEEAAKAIDEEVAKIIKEARDEAAGWRVKYKELNKTYEEVVASKTTLEEQLKSLDERIKKAKEEGKAELVKELEAERASKSELQEKLQMLEKTNKQIRIENALNRALNSYDVIDRDVVAEVLKSRIDVIDDEVRFKDGTPLDEGIKKFFEEKPHLLKAKGTVGSGAGANTKTGGEPKTLTELHLMKAKQLKK